LRPTFLGGETHLSFRMKKCRRSGHAPRRAAAAYQHSREGKTMSQIAARVWCRLFCGYCGVASARCVRIAIRLAVVLEETGKFPRRIQSRLQAGIDRAFCLNPGIVVDFHDLIWEPKDRVIFRLYMSSCSAFVAGHNSASTRCQPKVLSSLAINQDRPRLSIRQACATCVASALPSRQRSSFLTNIRLGQKIAATR
jgi:hypothetical protein